MRVLSNEEMGDVAGGWFFSCWSFKRSYCNPKPVCAPKPVCQPKPVCDPKPKCDPKPDCNAEPELPQVP